VSPPIESDPKPRPRAHASTSIPWPVRRSLRCPAVSSPALTSFADVFTGRRSSREIRRVQLRRVIEVIAYATRPRFTLLNDSLMRTRRPSPSAGALHPIEIIIIDWRGKPQVTRYDPVLHQLNMLNGRGSAADLTELRNAVTRILPRSIATTIVLVADVGRIAAVYDNPESLLWRDAGALLQTIFLSATAFRLAFCPLGIMGHQIVRYLGLESILTAVGTALIGKSATDDDLGDRQK
jgi:Nitroreductase family